MPSVGDLKSSSTHRVGKIDVVGTEDVTISLDTAKAEAARVLIGARSLSEAIDVALDRLIHDRAVPPPTDDTDADWDLWYAGDDDG